MLIIGAWTYGSMSYQLVNSNENYLHSSKSFYARDYVGVAFMRRNDMHVGYDNTVRGAK